MLARRKHIHSSHPLQTQLEHHKMGCQSQLRQLESDISLGLLHLRLACPWVGVLQELGQCCHLQLRLYLPCYPHPSNSPQKGEHLPLLLQMLQLNCLDTVLSPELQVDLVVGWADHKQRLLSCQVLVDGARSHNSAWALLGVQMFLEGRFSLELVGKVHHHLVVEQLENVLRKRLVEALVQLD